jgi:hypothetical protein
MSAIGDNSGDARLQEVIDLLLSYDQMAKDANDAKRELLTDYRERDCAGLTKADCKVRVDALKAAATRIKKRLSAPEKLEQEEQRDELAEQYVEIYDRSSRAPRATRAIATSVPQHTRAGDE